MRKISNIGDKELQNEEINVLAIFLLQIKNFESAKALLKTLMTKSELAVISQRLAILRMIKKDFKYSEIEEKLKTTPTTISKTIINYEKDEKSAKTVDTILKKFRFDPAKYNKDTPPDFSPNLSGGIRQYLREEQELKLKRSKNRSD